MNLNVNVARKVLETMDAGLSHGLGKPVPGQMCVEAAVCFALGLPHGDDPGCVAQSVRELKISLNDSAWSSNEARAKGLRRLAIAQLGTADVLDEQEFTKRCATLAIQMCIPFSFRAAAAELEGGQKADLLHWADVCEREPTQENASKARDAANYAAAYATYYAAYYAADAAYYAASAAYYAAAAAANAAHYAAAAANYAAQYAICHAIVPDQFLASFAEAVVRILIDLKALGCKWLHLTEG